jgi:hypothetical protein
MITLRDINALTNSKDGCIFSDLYKDVYGSRPGADYRFESIDAFDADMVYLSDKLDRQIAKQAIEQQNNFYEFVCQVDDMQKVMNNCTRERAIEHIAFGEGISKKEFDFYGLEILENELNLKYGSIAKWLSETA